MKSFGQWFGDQGRPVQTAPQPDDDDLPDGLRVMGGVIQAKCCCCDEYKEFFGEVSEFEEGNFYCGGSDRCCP